MHAPYRRNESLTALSIRNGAASPYRQNVYAEPTLEPRLGLARPFWALVAATLSLAACALVHYERDAGKFVESPVHITKGNLGALYAVTEVWRASHANDCPTVRRLIGDNELSASSDPNDAWGTPVSIRCAGDDSIVASAGPDRKWGTRDDLTYPESTP